MSADTTAFYILIFVLAAVALVGIALSLAYSTLFVKYKNIREELLLRRQKEAEEFQKTFSDAKRQSLLILDEARDSAKVIVSKAQNITNNNNTDVLNLINENLKVQRASYDQAFVEISGNIKKTFDQMPSDVRTVFEVEVQKLVGAIQKDMASIETTIQEALKEPFAIAQKEAEEYKKTRMKDFDEKLFEVLTTVSREVLRKELNAGDHEKIVIDALTEAKKRGGL